MYFEYDSEKSISNKKKHGIDFVEAQKLWEDDNLLEMKVAFEGESRFVVVGNIDGKNWTAVITYRNRGIRIISVRRSRKKEVQLYEKD